MATMVVDNQTQEIITSPMTEHKPWNQLPDESHTWYTRFLHFYLLQSRFDRSVLGAYRFHRQAKDNLTLAETRQVKCPPHSWYDAAQLHDWQSRAIAHDDHIDTILLDNRESNARKAKAKRIQMIDLVADSVMKYYATGEVKYDAGTANATLKTVLRESREEYQPTHRHDNRTQIFALIGQLPDNLQSALRGVLKSGDK